MQWETWFHEPTPQVRHKLKELETDIQNENKRLQADIGERFTDIIALSDRLDALKQLAIDQENHIGSFGSREIPRIPDFHNDSEQILDHANKKIGTWLAFMADRNILHQKYANAARALFLANELGIKSHDINTQSARLAEKLEQWLKQGSMISQSTYTALLVYLKCTSSELCQKFLEIRMVEIRKLLANPESSAALFKLVDSTSFIYNQIQNDLGQPRLISRKLIEMPQFASSTGFFMLIEPRLKEASQIKAYPDACYSTSSSSDSQIGEFIEKITTEVSAAAKKLLGGVTDVKRLSSILTSFVQQAQDVLSAETGALEILNAFEPAYTQRFLELIEEISGNWESELMQVRLELTQTARLSRATRLAAPQFSQKLDLLQTQATAKLETKINESYAAQRQQVLGLPTSTLDEIAQVLIDIKHLNATYVKLGGSPTEVPISVYEQFAELLKTYWKSRSKPKTYFGDSSAARAFEIQCIIDEKLGDFHWDPKGLGVVRERVLENAVPSEGEDGLLLRQLV